MKTLIIASVVAGLAASSAYAQTTTTTVTTTETTRTISEPQVDTIRTYVVDQGVSSVAAPSGVTVGVGTALPEPVPLYRLPDGVTPQPYQYTVIDGRTVIVDDNRNIVDILD